MKLGTFAQLIAISLFSIYPQFSTANDKELFLVDIPSGWRETDQKDSPHFLEQFSPADESFENPDYRIVRHRFGNISETSIKDYKIYLESNSKNKCNKPLIKYKQEKDYILVESLCPKNKSKEHGYASIQKIVNGEKYLWIAEYSWRTAPFKNEPVGYSQSKETITDFLTWSQTCLGDSECQLLREKFNDHLIETGRRAKMGVVSKRPKIVKW